MRVAHKLHTLIERAIGLDVNVILFRVRCLKDLLNVIVVPACSVNFKFYAEISWIPILGIFPEEVRLRLVPVIMDMSAFVAFFFITFTTIVVAIEVVCVIFINQCVAPITAGISVVIAIRAKIRVVVSKSIIEHYPTAAAVTGCEYSLHTV